MNSATFPQTGRTGIRRRHAVAASLLATFLLHLAFFPPAAREFLSFGHRARTLSEPEKKKLPDLKPEKKKDRRLQYMLVDQSRPDEKVSPENALARGAKSRLAREAKPDLNLPTGAPKFEKGLAAPPHNAAPPARPSNPMPRVDPARRSLPRPEERKTASLAEPERKTQKTARGDLERLVAPPAPKVEKADDRLDPKPVSKPRPKFVDMRPGSKGDISAPGKNTRTSAKLEGSPSMELLKARWGDYMQKVIVKMQQTFTAQCMAAPQSFRHGVVKISFSINPDGSTGNITIISPKEGLVSERGVCVKTIQLSGPFDPLTEEMAKDRNFQNIVAHFLFY